MTRKNMNKKYNYHALGIGSNDTTTKLTYNKVISNRLSLYYLPVNKKQYNDKDLPKKMKDMDWVKNEVLTFSNQQNKLNEKTHILPFRFGTVYATQEKMKSFLNQHKQYLHNKLAFLKNKSEWGVKVYLTRSTFKDWLKSKAGLTNKDQRGSGAEYFNYIRKEMKILANEEDQINRIIKNIEERIQLDSYDLSTIDFVEGNKDSIASMKIVSNYAILLEDNTLDQFNNKINELNTFYHECGISFRVSGPWPAFNFVNMN